MRASGRHGQVYILSVRTDARIHTVKYHRYICPDFVDSTDTGSIRKSTYQFELPIRDMYSDVAINPTCAYRICVIGAMTCSMYCA